MFECIFVRLFAGVPSDLFDAVPLIPLGQWLLPIGSFLLAAGAWCEKSGSIKVLSAYRCGTAPNWWRRHFGKGVVFGMRTAVLLLSAVFACDLLLGRAESIFAEEAIKISVLWLVHIVSLDAAFLLLNLTFMKRFVPAALLLFEGVTFITGYRIKAVSNIMYGTWGMYLRSKWCDTDGFCVGTALAAELFLLAAGYYLGHRYLKKSGPDKIWGKEKF